MAFDERNLGLIPGIYKAIRKYSLECSVHMYNVPKFAEASEFGQLQWLVQATNCKQRMTNMTKHLVYDDCVYNISEPAFRHTENISENDE